jgi:hypothetical protein
LKKMFLTVNRERLYTARMTIEIETRLMMLEELMDEIVMREMK